METDLTREKEIIDMWMFAWTNKTLGTDYTYARKFRDYWFDHSLWSIDKAWESYKNGNPN